MNLMDSAIEYKTTNSRAVSSNGLNSINKAFKIDRNGNLWAAFYVNRQNINIYKSIDNGFSWEWKTQIQAFSRQGVMQGDVLYFFESKALARLYLATSWGTIYEIWTDNPEPNPTVSGWSMGLVTDYVQGEAQIQQEGIHDGIYSMCGDLDDVAYFFYVTTGASQYLKCSEMSVVDCPRNGTLMLTISTAVSDIDSSQLIDSVSSPSYCDVVFVDNTQNVKHTVYDRQLRAFSIPTTIAASSYAALDPTIAIDGDGILLCAFSNVAGSATSSNLIVYTSSNWGATWTNRPVVPPAGTTTYLDYMTGRPVHHTSVLAGAEGGFILSAIFSFSGRPYLYVRHISGTGVMGDWKRVNSRSDIDVTGAQFFTPFADRLPYLGDFKNIRMAYQVGLGDNPHGHDSIITSVFQERLGNNAFVDQVDASTYNIDPISSGTLRVEFRVLGSFEDNINYFDENVTGEYTDSYIEAINKIGTPIKVNKYEPLALATDTGLGSYDTPEHYSTKILIDPQTYDFPTIARETSVFTQFIERDIRKAFFKPDFFMGRQLVLNDGGFLKRTVWTLYYLGNEYEISQIVPRFIDGEICFYEANVYVIGPSNDPFRKLTLPSET